MAIKRCYESGTKCPHCPSTRTHWHTIDRNGNLKEEMTYPLTSVIGRTKNDIWSEFIGREDIQSYERYGWAGSYIVIIEYKGTGYNRYPYKMTEYSFQDDKCVTAHVVKSEDCPSSNSSTAS